MCRLLWLRERGKWRQHESLEELEIEDLTMNEKSKESTEKSRFIQKHLNNMSETCRKILSLYNKGFTDKQIAHILRIDKWISVKNKKYYCKERLMEMLLNDPEFKEFNE
jgi:FixJ family two-component response regulator